MLNRWSLQWVTRSSAIAAWDSSHYDNISDGSRNSKPLFSHTTTHHKLHLFLHQWSYCGLCIIIFGYMLTWGQVVLGHSFRGTRLFWVRIESSWLGDELTWVWLGWGTIWLSSILGRIKHRVLGVYAKIQPARQFCSQAWPVCIQLSVPIYHMDTSSSPHSQVAWTMDTRVLSTCPLHGKLATD